VSPRVLNDTKPTARKKHACGCCYRVIEPGERYWRQDTVDGRDLNTLKTCAHCEALITEIYRIDSDARYYDEGVNPREWLFELGDPGVRTLFERGWQDAGGGLAPLTAVLGRAT